MMMIKEEEKDAKDDGDGDNSVDDDSGDGG